jgi:Flp pilus assembly protein TadG
MLRHKSNQAQAMVEFALALPVFLLVVYGLLETSRLVFMYSSATTASREAARYASAWGVDSNGDQQYIDCTGIRNAAKQVGFLLNLQDSNILIYHDTGPSTTAVQYCSPGTAVQTGLTLSPGNRVLVTVSSTYSPVLPFFLPLTQQTISSQTARTIMGLVDLNTPVPSP